MTPEYADILRVKNHHNFLVKMSEKIGFCRVEFYDI